MSIEPWTAAGAVVAGLLLAFRIGIWFRDRRAAALAAVVLSFCEEAAAYYRAREDGEITDEEARSIAEAAGRFFDDLEVVCADLLEEGLKACRTS